MFWVSASSNRLLLNKMNFKLRHISRVRFLILMIIGNHANNCVRLFAVLKISSILQECIIVQETDDSVHFWGKGCEVGNWRWKGVCAWLLQLLKISSMHFVCKLCFSKVDWKNCMYSKEDVYMKVYIVNAAWSYSSFHWVYFFQQLCLFLFLFF